MKLTEVGNPNPGVPDLTGITSNVWYIDDAGNLVIELEFTDDYGNLYFGYSIWDARDNTFKGLDKDEAEEILSAPFEPINIKEIIFEKVM